jgi:hypothetical protein
MLMLMKSNIEAMRGLCYWHAACMDLAEKSDEDKQRQNNHRRLEFLTPIVKGWCTELSNELTSYGVQVHGGMGYIEETGVAQHYRDARITTIYEGTTAIQANDLIGRKLLRDGGAVATGIVNEVRAYIDECSRSGNDRLTHIFNGLKTAIDLMDQSTQWLLDNGKSHPAHAAGASVNYLCLCGITLAGYKLIQQACLANSLLNDENKPENSDFLKSKILCAEFYCAHMLPRTHAYAQMVLTGSSTIHHAKL